MAVFLQRGAAQAATPQARTALRVGGGALSAVAAAGHLLVSVEHFEQGWVQGTLFIATGASQILLAALLLTRASARVVITGLCSTVVFVALYLAAHAPGIPTQTHAGHGETHAGYGEAVGQLDLVVVSAEAGLIVALALMLEGRQRRRALDALLVVGLAFWTVNLSGLLR
ncbi:MAG: hypothetical protein LC799_00015 [Actinobacteria bacterium]|nr:hypothetical protein [Actinomycetota bacterium]